MDAVTLRHVDKAYTSYSTEIVITGEQRQSRTRQVLKDLSVTFAAGQLTVIVGRSGCGKSTLLKLLAGKEQPDAGEISIPQGWHSAMLSPDPYVITLGSTSRNGSIAGFCMSVNLWGRMVVNSKAQRFFNEGYMPYQATVALSRTEDGIAWALGDSKFAGAALLDAAVDGTEVVKADTIEELAALMGVDADTLVKSVETYNTACATGNDTEFGKVASNLTAIDAAPYYAVRIYVCTGGTIAGVKTNLDFQVLREDGSVINGLYAGGETSNREMYAYAYSSGSGVGYALASGRQIGMNLMK